MSNENFFSEAALREEPIKKLKLQLKEGAVTTDKIADKAVTTAKIADGAVSGIKLSGNLVLELADHVATSILAITEEYIDTLFKEEDN